MRYSNRQEIYYIRVLADILVILAGYLLVFLLVPNSSVYRNGDNAISILIALVSIWIFSTNISRLYNEFRSQNISFELITIIKNILIQSLVFTVILFFFQGNKTPAKYAIAYAALLLILLSIEKFSIRKLLIVIKSSRYNKKSVLILGAGPIGRKLHAELITNPYLSYHFVGFLDDNLQPDLDGQYLGPVSALERVLEMKNVNDVILALSNYPADSLNEVLRICDEYPTQVRIIPDYIRFIPEKIKVSTMGSFSMISVRKHRINEFPWRLLRRIFDIVFSLLCFIFLFSWLFPLIALLIKIESRGPVFFRQERWGRNNKKFFIYKFRSMVCEDNDIDGNGKYRQASKNDERLTRIGKILRRNNIDELPQFLNVLKGETSIVGPRPHPTLLNLESKEYIEKYMQRHLVKPGITGWAQVNGFRGETSTRELMRKRVEYDLWYIENWSILLDIKIIILTIWTMIKGDENAY